jgi:chromosome segregation ATPase
MSDMDQRIFRGSMLGGFNRKDVMAYVEKTAEEFKEELSTLREQLELTRNQRDELRYSVSCLEEEKNKLSEKVAAFENESVEDKKRIGELLKQLEEFKSENALLSDEKSLAESSLKQTRAELETLKSRVTALEAATAEFEKTRKRIADIELNAYARSEEIEQEALHNAQKIRDAMKEAAVRTVRHYNQVRLDAESTAAHVNEELAQISAWLSSFGSLFSELDEVLEQIGRQAEKESPSESDEDDKNENPGPPESPEGEVGI